MEKESKHNWNDVEVHLQGKKIKDVSQITYTKNDFETLLFSTKSGVKMQRIPAMEFYLKRKNKYYFKNAFGVKFFAESDEILPFKKGDKFNINIQ